MSEEKYISPTIAENLIFNLARGNGPPHETLSAREFECSGQHCRLNTDRLSSSRNAGERTSDRGICVLTHRLHSGSRYMRSKAGSSASCGTHKSRQYIPVETPYVVSWEGYTSRMTVENSNLEPTKESSQATCKNIVDTVRVPLVLLASNLRVKGAIRSC